MSAARDLEGDEGHDDLVSAPKVCTFFVCVILFDVQSRFVHTDCVFGMQTVHTLRSCL